MSGELREALGRKITAKMPREELEAHLVELLDSVTVCTLSTSLDDVPRATPIEFFTDGLSVYMTPDPGVKVKNLKSNPNLSIGVFSSLRPRWDVDWKTIWGIQYTGQGTLLKDGDPGYDHGRSRLQFEGFFEALDIKELPRKRYILIQ